MGIHIHIHIFIYIERGRARKSSGCTLIISYYDLCMCVNTSTWRISHADDLVFLVVPNLKPVSEKTACDEGGAVM